MARQSYMLLVTPFIAVILLFFTVESFTPTQRVARVSSYVGRNIIQLYAAEDDSNVSSLPPLPSQKGAVVSKVVEEDADAAVKRMREDWAEPTSSSSTEVAEEEGTSYPIDLPSPVLLGLSMVLAISSIGKCRYYELHLVCLLTAYPNCLSSHNMSLFITYHIYICLMIYTPHYTQQ